MHKQRLALIVATLAGIASTFLPWAKVFGMSINGTVGDGWISLGIFAIIAILVLLGNKNMPLNGGMLIATIVMALLALGLGVYEIMNIRKSVGDLVEIGFGLYILIAAAAACLILPVVLKGNENTNAS
jgi:hypothetical protein